MASMWLSSAEDQENRMRRPGSTKGKAFNKLAPRGAGYTKKVSATPQKGLAFSVQQQGPAGRTFGDISNLLADRGAVITPARGKQLDKGFSTKKPAGLEQPAPAVGLVIESMPAPVKPSDTERDFFPVIAETEDYSDVLPPSFLLDHEDVQRLVQQWRGLQRAPRPLSPLRARSPPPSPPHLDKMCALPRLLQSCGLAAAEEFPELQMPMDW